ncbi:ribosomal-protein-serine acetyltransferase [Alkalibacillus flavidus]|uniref:Ribosomal-protein-serine acetyltransferase n=1 Tax=Alkalibacillus flavidus TaxID=546021 RepID=A0ABV2KX41_9BACI
MFTHYIRDDLYLKLLDDSDLGELFALTDRNRNDLRRWLAWVDHTVKPEDTAKFIQASKQLYAESKGMNIAVVFRGQLAGVVGFNQLDWTNSKAHIGYWLGKSFQSYGIMTDATRALMTYAFRDLNMNKVEIRAAGGNTKSRAIPERLGFVEEGSIRAAERLHGDYVDHIVYGLLQDEWLDASH